MMVQALENPKKSAAGMSDLVMSIVAYDIFSFPLLE